MLNTEAISHHFGEKNVAVVAHGHRINQKYLNNLSCNANKSWLFKSKMFLPYDYVHVVKCIRSNWLAEKCGELEYELEGIVQTVN